MARQRLGQHFLADPEWREQIAREIHVSSQSRMRISPPRDGDGEYCWIEIGAGHGEMTEHLVSTGAPVCAIELDAGLLPGLQRMAQRFANLRVAPGDVLGTDIAALAAGRRVRIYGNLPYYITSPILHHLFSFANLIDEMHLVVQAEVAERLAAEPKSKAYGYLSVATQLYARPEVVLQIPRGAFQPPPAISSALITLRFPGERRNFGALDERAFLEFVKLCFAKKRKTLVNNLRSLATPDRIRERLASLDLRPDARAEQLSIQHFAALQSSLERK